MAGTSPCEAKFEEIRVLLTQGRTRKQIAAAIGLSHQSVQAFLQRRKIGGVPRALRRLKVDQEALAHLLAEGHTHTYIAAMLGVSRSAIERRAAGWDLRTARTGPRAGQGHPNWMDGRALDKYGYVNIFVPLHPSARRGGCGLVGEHRLLMEVVVGRYLTAKEVVHHRDDHPRHNWPQNLVLYASNADHLRDELSGRAKASPRASIAGAYLNNQKIAHCPDRHETLGQCPEEIQARLAYYIESHRPTNAHRSLPARSFLRSGAWRQPFLLATMEPSTDSRP